VRLSITLKVLELSFRSLKAIDIASYERDTGIESYGSYMVLLLRVFKEKR